MPTTRAQRAAALKKRTQREARREDRFDDTASGIDCVVVAALAALTALRDKKGEATA